MTFMGVEQRLYIPDTVRTGSLQYISICAAISLAINTEMQRFLGDRKQGPNEHWRRKLNLPEPWESPSSTKRENFQASGWKSLKMRSLLIVARAHFAQRAYLGIAAELSENHSARSVRQFGGNCPRRKSPRNKS